jgi:phosphatidylserine/phosphatidylglycerophosphate/cardiolipin synthase-like enzyme
MKLITKGFGIFFIVIAGLVALDLGGATFDITSITGRGVDDLGNEKIHEPLVFFCPQDDCAENMVYLIEEASTIHCALFDLDHKDIIQAFQKKHDQGKDVRVSLDDKYYEEEFSDFAQPKKAKGLSHNKFCVFDNHIVWTGSFNPTRRGDENNNNNVVVYFSKTLAQNYEDEFQEIWEGVTRGDQVKYPKVMINKKVVENYFCPEGNCRDHVLENLQQAEKSIHFMTFSFTDIPISKLLVEKHKEGVQVQGVFENNQAGSRFSEFNRHTKYGLDVKKDHNNYMMHHKVFIIDEEIVITGSYNPSNNGNFRNDENILIIHDKRIAQQFMEEFNRVWEEPSEE